MCSTSELVLCISARTAHTAHHCTLTLNQSQGPTVRFRTHSRPTATAALTYSRLVRNHLQTPSSRQLEILTTRYHRSTLLSFCLQRALFAHRARFFCYLLTTICYLPCDRGRPQRCRQYLQIFASATQLIGCSGAPRLRSQDGRQRWKAIQVPPGDSAGLWPFAPLKAQSSSPS